MSTKGKQLEREKPTIQNMIAIYCRGHHQVTSGICSDCGSLLRYAKERIQTGIDR